VPGQHAADRLDPEPDPVVIDEGGHHGKRGSSSRAKKLDAANKISLARFNSPFSRSRSLIRFASSVVVPGRFPASMSVYLTHPRSVSGFTPILLPILLTAAVTDNPVSS